MIPLKKKVKIVTITSKMCRKTTTITHRTKLKGKQKPRVIIDNMDKSKNYFVINEKKIRVTGKVY